jgi:hypothetical protein
MATVLSNSDTAMPMMFVNRMKTVRMIWMRLPNSHEP